jgi:hypothetical protein
VIKLSRLSPSLGLLLAAACAEPLIDPEVVTGLRVIGARVTAADEPQRAELASAEAGTLEWWLVSDKAQTYVATISWCLAQETTIGLEQCKQKPFAQQEIAGDSSVPLRVDFELPAAGSSEHWLAWVGACQDAAPKFDWRERSFDCAKGTAVEGVYEGSFIQPDDAPNQNPDLDDDEFLVGNAAWPALSRGVVPNQPCTANELPAVRPGKTLHLHWRVGEDDREALQTHGEYGAPERESLVFTHLATEAGLERAFSALDWDSDKRGFDVDFTLPTTARPPREGRSIGLYLLATDERGGTAMQGRELCALP